MATETTAKESAPKRDAQKHEMPQLVVVELARRRSPEQVRRLRKGRGKLVVDIEDAIEELVKSGTINTDAQPVVIVVREGSAPLLWALDQDDDDEDEDEDDHDDEDEDDD